MLDNLLTRFAAYPAAWPQHLLWLQQAERWHRRGWLRDGQLAAIRTAYPLDFYRPAWPIRVLLFIATLIGFGLGGGFFGGFFVALADSFHLLSWALVGLVAAVFALEFGIREKKLYHAGPDNALLYIALLSAQVASARLYGLASFDGIGFDFDLRNPRLLPLLLIWLLIAAAAVVRYAERGVAVAAFLSYLLVIANLLLPWSWGRLALPLAGLAAAGAVAYFCRQPTRATPATYYYEGVRRVLRGLALATMYLSVNYLVVREANAALSGQYVSAHPPLGGVFIVLTALIPLAYLYFGLRRHDRLLLLLGFAALAFSFYTLRTYRALLPLSVAAALGGAVLLALAVFGLRYLRPARHGLTSHPDAADAPGEDDAANPFSRGNMESLVATQLAAIPASDTGPQTEFGGGQFGGGGASSDY